jgi:hypothetical protein
MAAKTLHETVSDLEDPIRTLKNAVSCLLTIGEAMAKHQATESGAIYFVAENLEITIGGLGDTFDRLLALTTKERMAAAKRVLAEGSGAGTPGDRPKLQLVDRDGA